MSFTGFQIEDFQTFHIEGLVPRMQAIRTRIQPKFRAISDQVLETLAIHCGNDMFLHIAQHARRKTNPPIDTWMAIAASKRGYKMLPHFQVGLFDDHVFIWLALIYELPNKNLIANRYIDHMQEIKKMLPADYCMSSDHMKKQAHTVSEMRESDYLHMFQRFAQVKKAELLIGRHFKATDPIVACAEPFIQQITETFLTLLPLYQLAHHPTHQMEQVHA